MQGGSTAANGGTSSTVSGLPDAVSGLPDVPGEESKHADKAPSSPGRRSVASGNDDLSSHGFPLEV